MFFIANKKNFLNYNTLKIVLSRLFILKYSFWDYNLVMIIISKRIKELRKERNISQIELASLCAVKQSCVSKWERGATLPDAEMIVLLTQILIDKRGIVC